MFVEQGVPGEFDRLRDGGQRDAPAPSLATDEFPRMSLGYIIQDLPNHDARTLEGRFAVANQRIGHDVLAEFQALGFAVRFRLHITGESLRSRMLSCKAMLLQHEAVL